MQSSPRGYEWLRYEWRGLRVLWERYRVDGKSRQKPPTWAVPFETINHDTIATIVRPDFKGFTYAIENRFLSINGLLLKTILRNVLKTAMTMIPYC